MYPDLLWHSILVNGYKIIALLAILSLSHPCEHMGSGSREPPTDPLY